MNTLSIYTVVDQSIENNLKIVHGIKMPRKSSKSLCGINPEIDKAIWISDKREITCHKCLSILHGKKIEFVFDEKIGVN